MPELFNVCGEIRCPFNLPSGCDRYTVSGHCHLIHPGNGIHRDDWLSDNQYWIFAAVSDPRIDINQLREENERSIASSESAQQQLRMRSLLSKKNID